MSIEESIHDFLRDAQYRVAEISITLNESDWTVNNPEYQEQFSMRMQLIQFMDSLYNARFSFIDNKYRFLDWTDDEIQREIEYLRYWCDIGSIPYLTFTAYYPWIVNNVVGSGGSAVGVPVGSSGGISGSLGQYLVFGLNNTLQPQDFPDRCGVSPGESINDYFAGRL